MLCKSLWNREASVKTIPLITVSVLCYLYSYNSNKNIKDQYADQSDHCNDGFHYGPGFDRVFYAKIKILFKHPEAGIVTVRKHKAAGANGEHHQVGVCMKLRHNRCNDTCCG